MARARPKNHRRSSDIAELIVAEWYRILPYRGQGATNLEIDVASLTAALNNILNVSARHGGVAIAVPDVEGQPLKVIIPLPPEGVADREALDEYLARNQDFFDGMGAASLFGCGR